MINNNRFEIKLYNIGKIIFIPFILLGFLFSNYYYPKTVENNPLFECFIRKHTGIICPGCFGTRAVVYLFKGEIFKSFLYNPAVIIAIVEYLIFMCNFFYRIHVKKDMNSVKINSLILIYIWVFVLIIQWIIKLILVMKGVLL